MNEATRKQIYSIIQSVVNIDPAIIDATKNLREQVRLDSMQFVAVLAKLETELNIELPISAMEAGSLNEFLSVLDDEMTKTGAFSK
jgi:acyl carrier protein